MTFEDFINIEVKDRNNYSILEIKKWIKKYNIKLIDKCIWITEDKWMANRYHLDTEMWNDNKYRKIPANKLNVITIKDNGFIIPESDDGDNGFLFIKK